MYNLYIIFEDYFFFVKFKACKLFYKIHSLYKLKENVSKHASILSRLSQGNIWT
jgi:hypothetical protein